MSDFENTVLDKLQILENRISQLESKPIYNSSGDSHPIQPFIIDKHGTLRFKENAIVSYLLEKGPFDMNKLALLPFSAEDRAQFAQLIGYSFSGFGDLPYVPETIYNAADELYEEFKETETYKKIYGVLKK